MGAKNVNVSQYLIATTTHHWLEMAKLLLYSLVVLLLASAFAKNFQIRIKETQNLLRTAGPTNEVLDEFDRLIQDLQTDSENSLKLILATALYNRALVEMSLNKMGSAIEDLEQVLSLDPDLKPARNTYKQLMVKRGDFAAARAAADSKNDRDLLEKMDVWEKTFAKFHGVLDGLLKKYNYEECLKLVEEVLRPLTPDSPAVLELHMLCNKKKAVDFLGKDREVSEHAFSSMLSDYSSLLKKTPQKNLERYSEFAKYLFFTRTNYQDAWTALKSCLRIDNENQQCGSLSKTFARLQEILKVLENYSILDGFVYPSSDESSDLTDERFQSFSFDWAQIHQFLNKDPVKAPKRELKNLPRGVKTNYDYLVMMAKSFAREEFGNEKVISSLKFYKDLTRLRCEAALNVEKSENCKDFCADAVEDSHRPFFPKHAARIDEEIKKKNFAEAQTLLGKFSKHVGKTEAFLKRWRIIEKYLQKQESQRQAKFHKEQQRQQQQWQRQQQQQQQYQQQQQMQAQSDPSKDYYKILDILKDADEKTIRKAYRSQTLKYHPDKYKGGDLSEKQVEKKMQEINEAYEVLSNKESKEQYDRGRETGANRGNGGQAFYSRGNPNTQFGFGNGGFNFGNGGFNFGNGGFDFRNGGFDFRGSGFKFSETGRQRKKRKM